MRLPSDFLASAARFSKPPRPLSRESSSPAEEKSSPEPNPPQEQNVGIFGGVPIEQVPTGRETPSSSEALTTSSRKQFPSLQSNTDDSSSLLGRFSSVVLPYFNAATSTLLRTVFSSQTQPILSRSGRVPGHSPVVIALLSACGYFSSASGNSYERRAALLESNFDELKHIFGPITAERAFNAVFRGAAISQLTISHQEDPLIVNNSILLEEAKKRGDHFALMDHLVQLNPEERETFLRDRNYSSSHPGAPRFTDVALCEIRETCATFDSAVKKYQELFKQAIDYQANINKKEKYCRRLVTELQEELETILKSNDTSLEDSVDLSASMVQAGWTSVPNSKLGELKLEICEANEAIAEIGTRLTETKKEIEDLFQSMPQDIFPPLIEKIAVYQMVASGRSYPPQQWSQARIKELQRYALETALRTSESNRGHVLRDAHTVEMLTEDVLKRNHSDSERAILETLSALRSKEKSAVQIAQTIFVPPKRRKEAILFLQERQRKALEGKVTTSLFDPASRELLFELKKMEIIPGELLVKYIFSYKGGQDDLNEALQQKKEAKGTIRDLNETLTIYQNTLQSINKSLISAKCSTDKTNLQESEHQVKISILTCEKFLDDTRLLDLSWSGIIGEFGRDPARISRLVELRDDSYLRSRGLKNKPQLSA